MLARTNNLAEISISKLRSFGCNSWDCNSWFKCLPHWSYYGEGCQADPGYCNASYTGAVHYLSHCRLATVTSSTIWASWDNYCSSSCVSTCNYQPSRQHSLTDIMLTYHSKLHFLAKTLHTILFTSLVTQMYEHSSLSCSTKLCFFELICFTKFYIQKCIQINY